MSWAQVITACSALLCLREIWVGRWSKHFMFSTIPSSTQAQLVNVYTRGRQTGAKLELEFCSLCSSFGSSHPLYYGWICAAGGFQEGRKLFWFSFKSFLFGGLVLTFFLFLQKWKKWINLFQIERFLILMVKSRIWVPSSGRRNGNLWSAESSDAQTSPRWRPGAQQSLFIKLFAFIYGD